MARRHQGASARLTEPVPLQNPGPETRERHPAERGARCSWAGLQALTNPVQALGSLAALGPKRQETQGQAPGPRR